MSNEGWGLSKTTQERGNFLLSPHYPALITFLRHISHQIEVDLASLE